MRIAAIVLPTLAAWLGLTVAGAHAAPVLASHRAVYDLTLEKASDRSGIDGIEGRMVYEFTGSACAGYTTRFRYVTRIGTQDVLRVTDLQTTMHETSDGKTFDFASKSYIDQQLDKEVKGQATATPQGTEVAFEKPQGRSLMLPEAMFPTAHLLDLLEKASAGENFYQAPLFDGAEDADKVMTTTVVIGKPKPVAGNDPERDALKELAGDAFWPVDIAYFDGGQDDAGEQLPAYKVSMKLHENGITRDLTMDYGEFSIHARLAGLTLFDPEACKPK